MADVLKVTEHDTKECAEAHGEKFKEAWGSVYFASYMVWQQGDKWMCETSRAPSCE